MSVFWIKQKNREERKRHNCWIGFEQFEVLICNVASQPQHYIELGGKEVLGDLASDSTSMKWDESPEDPESLSGRVSILVGNWENAGSKLCCHGG